jgi:hypothetical protein
MLVHLTVKFIYDTSKVKTKEIAIIYFYNLNPESELIDNSLTND